MQHDPVLDTAVHTDLPVRIDAATQTDSGAKTSASTQTEHSAQTEFLHEIGTVTEQHTAPEPIESMPPNDEPSSSGPHATRPPLPPPPTPTALSTQDMGTKSYVSSTPPPVTPPSPPSEAVAVTSPDQEMGPGSFPSSSPLPSKQDTTPPGPSSASHPTPHSPPSEAEPEDQEPSACSPRCHPTFLANRGGRLEVAAAVKELTSMGFYDSQPQIPDPIPKEDVEVVIPWGTSRWRIGIGVSLLFQLCVAVSNRTAAVVVIFPG